MKEMERVKVYGKPGLIPFTMGNCPGCTHGLVQKLLAEVIDEMGIAGDFIGIGGVGCGMATFAIMDVDAIGAPHGPALALGAGLKHALFEKPIILTAQGDGDCAAIGMGYLINAAVRAERLTCVMVNNGNYGTTGGQMAPTTLRGQVTTTTPKGRDPKWFGHPIHVPELLANIEGVAYCARTALNSPANYTRTKKYVKTAIQKQIDDVGFSFVEILAVCPPDWHMKPLQALEFLEERTMAEFPLGEFKNVEHID